MNRKALLTLVWTQLRQNIVAIGSIVVALTGLAYNTWRNEQTEINHSVRIAAFETLKYLGEVQTVVEYAHFKKNRQLGDTVMGGGRVKLIRDIAHVLPAPGPANGDLLFAAWRDNVDQLENDSDAMIKITDEIQRMRLTTLEIIDHLR